jgi:hypothetical protein
MVLIVGKRLRRCNDDGITSMCAERIKVLHVTANDSVLGWWLVSNEYIVTTIKHTSAPSRTTSYSNSFQPFMLRSMSTCGLKLRLRADKSLSSSGLFAKPDPSPPRVNAERRMTG